jgi:CBS domain-containing protein
MFKDRIDANKKIEQEAVMKNVSDLLKIKGNQVWSVTYDLPIKEALHVLAQNDVGALPVTKDGKLVGIFSERDYARKMAQKEECSMNAPVSEIMTSKVFFVNLDCSIEDCMALMTERHIRHLPVLENEGMVGMISIGDLVKGIITTQKDQINMLENYIQGKW